MSSFHTSPRFYARFLTNVSDIQKVAFLVAFSTPAFGMEWNPGNPAPLKALFSQPAQISPKEKRGQKMLKL